MKKLLAIIILSLYFITSSKADDIRDFQIEGISVGDSALDHFSKEEINNGVKDFYKDKKFLSITIPVNSDSYDTMDFIYKPKDKKYKIYGIRGLKIFKNIKDCKIEYEKAIKGLSEIFINSQKVDAKERSYAADPTGKSKIHNVYFWLKSGGFAEVACYDMTEEFSKQKNWENNSLTIAILTKEFSDFLLNEHYK